MTDDTPDASWRKAHYEAVEELSKSGATGVILGKWGTNLGLAKRDYDQRCVSAHVTDSGDKNFYGVGGCITMYKGYWLWWCKIHHQPMAWCDKGRVEEYLRRVESELNQLKYKVQNSTFIDRIKFEKERV